MRTAQVAVCCLAVGDDGARGTFFSHAAFRYVDVMIGAAAAAAVLAFALAAVLAPGDAVAPGAVLLVCGGAVVAAGIGLIVVVLRTLLAQAIYSRRRGARAAGQARRGDLMPIVVDVDVVLAKRKMSVGELAQRVGITPANLAVLKNGRAKAVRFTTLSALCEVLDCQPGDLLHWEPGDSLTRTRNRPPRCRDRTARAPLGSASGPHDGDPSGGFRHRIARGRWCGRWCITVTKAIASVGRRDRAPNHAVTLSDTDTASRSPGTTGTIAPRRSPPPGRLRHGSRGIHRLYMIARAHRFDLPRRRASRRHASEYHTDHCGCRRPVRRDPAVGRAVRRHQRCLLDLGITVAHRLSAAGASMAHVRRADDRRSGREERRGESGTR